ncbi:MAG: class I SAM-dependent methyltransferase [Pseudomonadales bacterium]|nr:class I SAM-dependent methyltransferase [Gammaproteobacteria bacterium]NNL56981.1 class I SAM-dependent methyltransferase [Pseudomonadales bacterium]
MLTIDFERLAIAPGSTVLDLGCGEGRHCIHAYLLHDSIRSVGVDLNFSDLRSAQKKLGEFPVEPSAQANKQIGLYCANGLQLPFATHSFDVVICSEVLEHIADYPAMLGEITRVVKPDGVLAISVPRAWPEHICWWLCEAYHRVEGGHIRIFNAARLQREIGQFGFEQRAKHWAHALHVPYWWLKCLFWQWPNNYLLRAYHRLLVWDLMQRPRLTRALDALLNPVMGKSVVMYFDRESGL